MPLVNGVNTTYVYGHASRLLTIDHGAAGRFDYSYNNVNSEAELSRDEGRESRAGAPGTTGLAHGANGNLTGRDGWAYVYDAQNRKIEAVGATNRMAFAHDARNRVVRRTSYTGALGSWAAAGELR